MHRIQQNEKYGEAGRELKGCGAKITLSFKYVPSSLKCTSPKKKLLWGGEEPSETGSEKQEHLKSSKWVGRGGFPFLCRASVAEAHALEVKYLTFPD